MSLLVWINFALGAVFVAATLIAGYVCRNILEANAQREVLAEAGLLMDSALGIRDYTENEIAPLISERIQNDFPPQAVPFYAATQNFQRVRERHPEWGLSEIEFKCMLAEAHRAGRLLLANADLKDDGSLRDVAESALAYKNAVFHFVRVDV